MTPPGDDAAPASEFGETQFAERLEERETRIREAAKWLIGSFAAVGAALIAGSQLSSIGKLPVCGDFSTECGRLWVAVAGALASLLGVVWAIWTGVALLAPARLHLSELKKQWKKGGVVRTFFTENKGYWQGFRDFDDIEAQEHAAERTFDELDRQLQEAEEREAEESEVEDLLDRLEEARARLDGVYARSDMVILQANHVHYTDFFRRRAMRHLFAAAAISALGIVAFAWAANPPASAAPAAATLQGADLAGADLSHADLRNVDLGEADLTGADLTGANLEGADLEGAVLDDVVWAGTTCPDGTSSDDAGSSCESHL